MRTKQEILDSLEFYGAVDMIKRDVGSAMEEYANNCIAELEAKACDGYQHDFLTIYFLQNQSAKYRTALEAAKAEIGKEYYYACDNVDWYNNYTPQVGRTLDYKAYPQKPKALEIIERVLEEGN